MWMEFVFEAVLVGITGGVGTIGNILLIAWFTNMDKRLNFHHLMITLATFDTIYIVSCILVFSVPSFFEGEIIDIYYSYLVPVAIPIIQIALTGSIYCTGAISLERYLTVCHPFYVKQKNWSAKRYILPIVIFSLCYNTPRFFEMRTKINEVKVVNNQNKTFQPETDYLNLKNGTAIEKYELLNLRPLESFKVKANESSINENEAIAEQKLLYRLELTNLRNSTIYYSAYTIGLNFFFNGFFPFALILILNSLMYRQLMRILRDPYNRIRKCSIVSFDSAGSNLRRRSVHKRIKPSEIDLAKVSLLIVAVFIVCHSIRWIPNIYELIQRLSHSGNVIAWPTWVENVTNVSHFITVLNSSVNFYIYYLTHQGIPIYRCVKSKQISSNFEMQNMETLISNSESHRSRQQSEGKEGNV